MTTPTGSADTTGDGDRNREMKVKARRALDRLMQMAAAGDFNGSITVEVSVQEGRFVRIRQATNAYDR